MIREFLPIDETGRVSPRALQGYAKGLGWQPVSNGRRGDIALLHRPDSKLHQVAIPLDDSLSDYNEAVAEAIQRLAEFEKRPAREVLDHLLLPPADILQFREKSRDAEAGSLPFEHAVRMINGTKRLLLSAAHSVLVPQAYHPRLSRSEAEEFVNECRLGQTGRGSFVFSVACPLAPAVALPGMQSDPFARQVTTLLIRCLEAIVQATSLGNVDDLLNPAVNSGLSANFCESLLMLRPSGDSATLTISAAWSKALLPPSGNFSHLVQLSQETFEIAEVVASQLRTLPNPRVAQFLGTVDALRGQPTQTDSRPSGEVDFTIFDYCEEIHARGLLTADQYALAGKAHLAFDFVGFKGVLRPSPRVCRVEEITNFEIVKFDGDLPEPPPAQNATGDDIPF